MIAHNIVVVGASAGGIAALQTFAHGLPSNLQAAILVVVHTSPDRQSGLAEILSRAGNLPADLARDGEQLAPGKIYVAPSDRHMLIARDKIKVVFGPRENLFRPAIDPLFRSAAATFQGRIIGILLSGGLDDGCSGLNDILRSGGVTIVQDPADAQVPNLPLNALRRVSVDYTLPASQIAEAVVTELAKPGETITKSRSGERNPLALHPPNRETATHKEENSVSSPQTWFDGITCPDCHGPIFEENQQPLRFRCIVGHSYSPGSMRAEHSRRLENALWTAIAGFEEHATILRRLAEASASEGDSELRELEEQALEQDGHARELRAFIERVSHGTIYPETRPI